VFPGRALFSVFQVVSPRRYRDEAATLPDCYLLMGDLIKSSDIWFNDGSRYNDALSRKQAGKRGGKTDSSRENEPDGVATPLVIESATT